MSKGRTQTSSVQQLKKPVYLDSAFKQLLRQQHKAASLKNRAKVLQLNHQRLLKQIENTQNKWTQVQKTQQNHSSDISKLKRDREAKDEEIARQKAENSRQKENHERQMSLMALQKASEIEKLKNDALLIRKENRKMIAENRELEIQKKKQVRNKIHDDILQSRTTIKNFFAQKHEQIVAANSQEVKKLNSQRAKEELEAMSNAGREVASMQSQVKSLKQTLQLSRLGAPVQKKAMMSKHEQADKHPLVRRIESVMNKYTKFL